MECDEKSRNEEHERLAGIVKGIHKHLRREFRANNHQYESVWQQHAQNQDALQLYADAMYRLATEHWSLHPETRIDWCKKVAIEYFLGGGLKVALEKDAKRKFHENLRARERVKTTELQPNDLACRGSGNQASADPASHSSSQPDQHLNEATTTIWERRNPDTSRNNVIEEETVSDNLAKTCQLQGKIRLLDVGSCYNPFQAFEEFDTLGIDLSPAIESVLQCDFLQLKTVTLPAPDDPVTFDLTQLTSPLHQLPGASFHAVVFSLLLEYLPSPVQRFHCCLTAHSLLAMQGLLLLVTPDSHSQHRNAPMMKSWKLALESLGFLRWKYEKKDHIHCMAFRKVSERPDVTSVGELNSQQREGLAVEEMLYIPQDFSDACYDDVDVAREGGTEGDDDAGDEETREFVASAAAELPLFDSDGD